AGRAAGRAEPGVKSSAAPVRRLPPAAPPEPRAGAGEAADPSSGRYRLPAQIPEAPMGHTPPWDRLEFVAPVRRRSFVQLALLAAVIAAATTAVAVVIPWLPVSASRERDRIDFTFWLATGIAILIFSVVAATILYSVWRFRVHPEDDSDGPPIHGHTGLEIVWTAIPTALVTVIAIA